MTEPLTPPECNLTDFAFMPLDVARLRDSELASNETPEACWAAVLLWAASWHQVPAASIPNDDKWIAKAAGYAQRGKIAREWANVRSGALRGFIECSDGRLYHPVVAEKAREAWQAKLRQRWGSECARIKKHNERHAGANVEKPTFDDWLKAGCPQGQPLFVPSDKPAGPQSVDGDNGSKGQGEGQGQGQPSSVPSGTGVEPPPGKPEGEDPPDPKRELYAAGKSLLHAQGLPKAQCGSFITKLAQDYGQAIALDAVRSAVSTQPLEAAAYMKATCQRLKGERKDPVTVASDGPERTAAALAVQSAHPVEPPPASVADRLAKAREAAATAAALHPVRKIAA